MRGQSHFLIVNHGTLSYLILLYAYNILPEDQREPHGDVGRESLAKHNCRIQSGNYPIHN